MSRKNFHRYTPFNDSDASVAFDNKANPTEISHLDNFGIQITWNDPTLVGEFKVLVSNEDGSATRPPQKWSELDFGTSIIVDSTNSDILINLNQNPYKWLALSWAPTSGTGNLTVSLTSKMVGG